jgi:2-oxoglutarate ferredoxin oxidoreductase subunit beta
VISVPFQPLAVAIALGCGFVARGLATDAEFTADLMVRAIAHKGFALVDIFQPCVTFNKKNTAQWYGRTTYRLPPDHDPSDRQKAFELAMEGEERIPLGVLYRRERPSLEEVHPGVGEPPLHSRETTEEAVREMLRKRVLALP